MLRSLTLIPALIVLFCWQASVAGDTQQPPQVTEASYDVQPLLGTVPDFRPPGPTRPDEPGEIDPEQWLLRALRLGLSADERPVELRVEDERLHVLGSTASHEAIQRLLQELIRKRSLQVNVEVRFVDAPVEALNELEEPIRRAIALAEFGAQPLTAEEARQLLAGAGIESLTAPNITLFNQQRAFVQVTTDQFLVADYEMGPAGWKAVGRAEWTGIRTEVRAGADVAGGRVAAQVQYTLRALQSVEERRHEPSGQMIQVPEVYEVRTDRIIQARDGEIVLAGVHSAPARPGVEGEHVVIVLVRMNIIDEKRDAAAEERR